MSAVKEAVEGKLDQITGALMSLTLNKDGANIEDDSNLQVVPKSEILGTDLPGTAVGSPHKKCNEGANVENTSNTSEMLLDSLEKDKKFLAGIELDVKNQTEANVQASQDTPCSTKGLSSSSEDVTGAAAGDELDPALVAFLQLDPGCLSSTQQVIVVKMSLHPNW